MANEQKIFFYSAAVAFVRFYAEQNSIEIGWRNGAKRLYSPATREDYYRLIKTNKPGTVVAEWLRARRDQGFARGVNPNDAAIGLRPDTTGLTSDGKPRPGLRRRGGGMPSP